MKKFSLSSHSNTAHVLNLHYCSRGELLQCWILNLNLAWKAVFRKRKWKHQLKISVWAQKHLIFYSWDESGSSDVLCRNTEKICSCVWPEVSSLIHSLYNNHCIYGGVSQKSSRQVYVSMKQRLSSSVAPHSNPSTGCCSCRTVTWHRPAASLMYIVKL